MMDMEMIARIGGPIVALAGLIALVYGVRRIQPMIFPRFRWEIPIFAIESIIDFPEAGQYEFFVSRKPKFRMFRRAIQTCDADFTVQNLKSGETIPYEKYSLALWTRSDMRGHRSSPVGIIEIPTSGSYQIKILGDVYYKDENYISVMSYQGGGLRILIAVWCLLLGAFLTIGGIIFSSIAWTTGF